MYQQLGGSALLLLLVTSAISHLSGPNRAMPVVSGSGGQSAASAEKSAVEADQRTCFVYEALRLYLGSAEGSAPPAANQKQEEASSAQPLICSAANFSAVFPAGLSKINTADSQVLIATVPDPLQTSEALQFDRDISALQEAASTAGYDFQRISTPWQTSDLSAAKDLKEA